MMMYMILLIRNQLLVLNKLDGCARRILIAYSIRNKEVGYCQGMDHIIGVLLTCFEEETSFW